MATGCGIGRGLLCTLLVLVGSLSTWLGVPGHEREVASVLPVVLASLGAAEEEATGAWSLRSKQEHAGAVAIMKLCESSPAAVVGSSSLSRILDALHGFASREPCVRSGLSKRSSSLLLVAAADLVAHVCVTPSAQRQDDNALVNGLLGPPLSLLEQASRGGGGDALHDAARAAERLSIVLPRIPSALQQQAATMLAPWQEALIHLLCSTHDDAAVGACDAIAALCAGCCARAASLVPSFAVAAWSCFAARPKLAFKLADALGRCASMSTVVQEDQGAPTQLSSACSAASELVMRIAAAMSALPSPASSDEYMEQQSLLAELFDLASAWTAIDAAHAQGLAAVLSPSLPMIFGVLWQTMHRIPPHDALETQRGVLALKRGLLLLQRAQASTPAGCALYSALMLAPASPVDNGAQAEGGSQLPAVQLMRAVLEGLSSWFPSWLLSDVVAALWALRQVGEAEFANCVRLAFAADGVPRHGITTDQKSNFERQLTVDAKTKSAFKAALKQCCGGALAPRTTDIHTHAHARACPTDILAPAHGTHHAQKACHPCVGSQARKRVAQARHQWRDTYLRT